MWIPGSWTDPEALTESGLRVALAESVTVAVSETSRWAVPDAEPETAARNSTKKPQLLGAPHSGHGGKFVTSRPIRLS